MGAGESQGELVARARRVYRDACGCEPVWGALAPGRVNLIGDHTDYTGGLALPMAIDLWCVAVGGPARDPARTLVVSADRGKTAALDRRMSLPDAVGGLPTGHWARYAAGVLAEMEGDGVEVPPLDVVVAGSVPLGSGLSSSAALEVAVATLVEEAAGVRLEGMRKARVCQRAEHRWAGVKCGLMDQMCAVMGREGCALMMDFTAPSAEAVRLPDGLAVLVANSNVRHSLAEGTYGRIVEECERARVALGVRSLRELTLADVDAAEDRMHGNMPPRARHVVTENGRVMAAAEALRAADLERLGVLMIESHHSLREYGVSCIELDSMVDILTGGMAETAMSGVYGARMTGGGFGGCIVAAVAPWAVQAVGERLIDGYRRRHSRECDVFVVEASGGARGLTAEEGFGS